MILIISEEIDSNTDHVCDWLNYNNQQFIRINKEDNVDIFDKILISNKNNSINFRHKKINFCLEDIKIIWFRRGIFNISGFETDHQSLKNYKVAFKNHFYDQKKVISEYVYWKLLTINHINDPFNYNVNKLIVLNEAVNCGLLIPQSLISKSLKQVKRFLNNNKYAITKDICEPITRTKNPEFSFHLYTSKLEINQNSPLRFWYSLFQKLIIKKYELRIFFANEKYFCAAILSQLNNETLTDFRTNFINSDKPLRIVPFNLPEKIQNKLVKLMSKLKLNSGSIDMIVDTHDNYIFLEVNPVGQFDFINMTCNFNIEKIISQLLSYE